MIQKPVDQTGSLRKSLNHSKDGRESQKRTTNRTRKSIETTCQRIINEMKATDRKTD